MSREEQIINERLRKLKELREEGINPYPEKFDKKQNISECLKTKINGKVKTALLYFNQLLDAIFSCLIYGKKVILSRFDLSP